MKETDLSKGNQLNGSEELFTIKSLNKFHLAGKRMTKIPKKIRPCGPRTNIDRDLEAEREKEKNNILPYPHSKIVVTLNWR